MTDALHALQVNVQMDELRREPEALLAAWPTLVDVAEAAREAGVRVTVLQAADRDAELEREGVRYLFVRERPPSAPRKRAGPWATPARHALAGRAAALEADLVHLHGFAFPLHGRALARALGLPILVQHRADVLPPAWRRPVDRFGFAAASAAAFTAREQARPWVRAGVLAPDLPVAEVLGSSSRFEPGDRDEARAATGLSGDPCLLWVGRLNRIKDPLTALDAVARTAERLPDLRLWCCYSEAPMLEDVQRRIARDPRLTGRVHLLGFAAHPQVQELCRAADLFVSASLDEGTGFALLEALACGLTPVVTDIPSFRRMTGGRVGSLVPCGDPEAMADAIVRHARCDRETARRDATRHFRQELSFTAVGRELAAAYREAVRAGPRGHRGNARKRMGGRRRSRRGGRP